MQPYPGYPYPHAAPPGYAYPYPVQSTSHHPAPPPPHSLSEVHNDDPAPRKRARVSSAGPASAKGGKGGTKGRKGAAAGPDSEGDDDDAGRKRRIPLSCTECVRRKIKCDRVMPCSSCVRRKRVEFCTFEDEDPSTPYAPTSEVRALARRLAHLESLFQLAHPNLKTTSYSATFHASPASHQSHASPSVHYSPGHALSHSQQTSPAHGQLPVAGSQADAARPRNDDRNGEDDSPASHSDTEDAVADLEEQTFGARVPVLRALHAAAQGPVATYKYVKVPDMELTSCLTSILAEPLSFDQDGRPSASLWPSLPTVSPSCSLSSVVRRKRRPSRARPRRVDGRPASRPPRRARPDLCRPARPRNRVIPPDQVLPRGAFTVCTHRCVQGAELATLSHAQMEWDFRVLDPVAFPIEHERYVQMLATGREDLIDPLWIACFCMVLALSLEGFFSRPTGRHDLSLFRGLSETDLKDLPSVWHDAALRALQLGEWGGTPRIRTVQCCVLFAQYIQISSSSGQQGRFLGWAASAFRVAQRMGLHRLGSDPQTMPPDDPALPPGCNAVKRQSAVRLWHHLVNIDSWLSDSPSLRCYVRAVPALSLRSDRGLTVACSRRCCTPLSVRSHSSLL